MASKVSIANRALTKLGAERILALTDDSKQARTVNSMFDQVIDGELRRYRWKFAMKRGSLPALVDTPSWGYQYQYPLPDDCLQLVQVNDYFVSGPRYKGPWSVEGGSILTDIAAPLKIRYVSRVTDTAQYDPLFIEALACKLAWECCEDLTQSGQKKESAMNEYKWAMTEAVRQDAIENPPDLLPQGSWLDSRGSEVPTGNGESWSAYGSGFTVF